MNTPMTSSGHPHDLSKTVRAKVYKGQWGFREVAIKEVIGCTQDIDLMAIRNRNVIQFYSHSDRIQVMDLADHGNLADNIDRVKYKKEEIAKQISSGLVYFQSINFVHKKIRPSNILLDRNFDAKIAGFGSESDDLDSSRKWMAPELLEDPPSPHSFRTDIYALGMVMKEMGKGSKDYMQWMIKCQSPTADERPLECPISDEPQKGKDRPALESTTKEEKLQELKDIALEDKSGEVADHLADMYHFNHKVPKDDDEALKWRLIAANLGKAEAQNTLGTYYFDMGDHTAAEDWYLKSAKQRCQEAWTNLGDLLSKQFRYDEAEEWYRKAALDGDAHAQYNLGEMYYRGYVTQDDSQAFEWFYKAAVQGHVDAEYSVAYMYWHERGTAFNYKEAEKWFMAAIEKGHVDAKRDLESMRMATKPFYWLSDSDSDISSLEDLSQLKLHPSPEKFYQYAV
ncbi:hypothetical protein BGZ51_004948 [Haplosporangium sp. Z 767]|nr:hypothetical protein BGZ51_004948 [Haplosporangium sp. Z 767]